MIPQKYVPNKSCVSCAREEVSKSTIRTDKGKGNVELREDLHHRLEVRKLDVSWTTAMHKEVAPRSFGGQVTQFEKG